MDAPRNLPAELTIYTASELHATCLAWLGEPPGEEHTWPLGAAAVDQADAAGVQLLVALSRTLADQSRPLRLCEPSPCLTEACDALGLGDWLSAHRAPGASA